MALATTHPKPKASANVNASAALPAHAFTAVPEPGEGNDISANEAPPHTVVPVTVPSGALWQNGTIVLKPFKGQWAAWDGVTNYAAGTLDNSGVVLSVTTGLAHVKTKGQLRASNQAFFLSASGAAVGFAAAKAAGLFDPLLTAV